MVRREEKFIYISVTCDVVLDPGLDRDSKDRETSNRRKGHGPWTLCQRFDRTDIGTMTPF